MVAVKEAVGLTRVHLYDSKGILPLCVDVGMQSYAKERVYECVDSVMGVHCYYCMGYDII